MNNDRLKKLRAMLEQVDAWATASGLGESLESASSHGGAEALGVAGGKRQRPLAEHGAEFAIETLDVFVPGKELDRDQQFVLEAIVMPFNRPVVDILNDQMTFLQLGQKWNHLGTDAAKRTVIEKSLLSIGRIEIPNNSLLPYAGTGFVVGAGLLMTNRHVASMFALGVGSRNLTFISGQTAKIDFLQELPDPPTNPPKSDALTVTRVKMIHPYWDMALLEVTGLSSRREPLRLSTVDPADLENAEVVTIGYPGFDPNPDVEFQKVQSRVFRDIFYVKRLQPGLLRKREIIESHHRFVPAITHDCSTLGGNSGSAVIDLKTGNVVGLHFAGAYLHANYAVPTFDLAADRRVVDAGVNFQDKSVSLSDQHEPLWIASGSESAAPPITTSATFNSPATWHIPLVVTVDIGGPRYLGSPPAVAASVDARRVEGLFGPPAREFSLTEMAEMFSPESLTEPKFHWKTALTLAAASKFAYESGSVIEPFGVGGFGFETCKFIEASDTQCFIASTAKAVLISFRGTESIGDWLINLQVHSTQRPYGRVHTGFLRGFEFVQMQLENVLNQFPNRPLLITGHSLGGAVATVASAEWVNRFPVAGIYTYGQPGTGKGNFSPFMAQHYDEKFFRFVNDDDIVPQVPPGYDHVGKLFHFDARGRLAPITESLDNVKTDMMTDAQFKHLQATLRQTKQLSQTAGEPTTPFADESMQPVVSEGFFPSVKDHGMDRYLEKISKMI